MNLSGALLAGLVWGFFENKAISENFKMLAMIGFLGAYTTFSTFCLENLNLFRAGEIRLGVLNILLSNILGLAFVFAGFFL